MTKMKVDEHDECSEKTPNLMIHKTLFFLVGAGSVRELLAVAGGQKGAGGGRQWQEVSGVAGRQCSAGGWQQ